MKNTTLVALLLLSTQCFANSIKDSLENIESEWASIYYNTPNTNQSRAYSHLLDKIIALSEQHTDNAELIFWQAVVKATNADYQDAFTALNSIKDARKLLAKAIEINPKTMNGSAYVTLGTLYYMVPKWPIAFGDDQTAQKMLEIALQINPNGIDSNYFYGKFLLSQNKPDEAAKYFEIAVRAPARNEQFYADSQLKTEASLALKNAKEQKVGNSKNLFLSLFSSATLK
jgi:tetratricopeptide (TPR) repeat protein